MPTPYLGLTIPTVTVTPGPDYANDVNGDLNIIDGHDHSPSNGKQVPTSGLDINADLPMNGHALTALLYGGFSAQSGPLTGVSRVYVSGVDLYFNDGNGVQIQLTASGAINVSSVGGFSGDYATTAGVTASYTAASKVFEFFQAASKDAKIKAGDYLLTDISTTSGHAVTLKVPAGLAADYTITTPGSAPGSTLPVTMDASGVLATAQLVTAQLADASVTTAKIADANVTTAKIADANVTTAKINDGAVTRSKLAAVVVSTNNVVGPYNTTSSSFVSTNLPSATLTTVGRPVILQCVSSSVSTTNAHGYWDIGNLSGIPYCRIAISRDGGSSFLGTCSMQGPAGADTAYPASSVAFIDHSPAAGTYTWQLYAAVETASGGGTSTLSWKDIELVAYELA